METDRASYIQEAEGPAPVAIVSIENEGGDPVKFLMCELPGDGDVAPLRVQRQEADESWSFVHSGFCPTPVMYEVTVEGGETKSAGRVTVGPDSGTYRFLLYYESDDGTYDLAPSNKFIVIVPGE